MHEKKIVKLESKFQTWDRKFKPTVHKELHGAVEKNNCIQSSKGDDMDGLGTKMEI